jgi:peroxiredoxin
MQRTSCAAAAIGLMAMLSLSCQQELVPPRISAAPDRAGGPTAEGILQKMADYFGALPAFSCRIERTIHLRAPDVERRMETKLTVRLQRPNRLAAVADDGGTKLFSDGSQWGQYVAEINSYSVQEAPDDFAAMRDPAETVALTLLDFPAEAIPSSGEALLRSILTEVIATAYVGTEKIGDIPCDRCRLVRDDFDMDLWIGQGEKPLVHKIVLDMSKRMQRQMGGDAKDVKLDYTVDFRDWNVRPEFASADFAFVPPEGARRVASLAKALREGPPHPLVGQPAPAFETVGLDGKPVDLKALLKQKVVILDFWATWCGPCIEAMPEVLAVAKKYQDKGVVLYAVNVAEDAATVRDFLRELRLDVPVAFDSDGRISDLYQASGIPQTVLIGKDGNVQVVHVGFGPNLTDELSQEIEALLAGKNLAAERLGEQN